MAIGGQPSAVSSPSLLESLLYWMVLFIHSILIDNDGCPCYAVNPFHLFSFTNKGKVFYGQIRG